MGPQQLLNTLGSKHGDRHNNLWVSDHLLVELQGKQAAQTALINSGSLMDSF